MEKSTMVFLVLSFKKSLKIKKKAVKMGIFAQYNVLLLTGWKKGGFLFKKEKCMQM
jgi:hypothetical protein